MAPDILINIDTFNDLSKLGQYIKYLVSIVDMMSCGPFY